MPVVVAVARGTTTAVAVTLRLSDEPTAAYLTSLLWGAFTLGRLLAIPLRPVVIGAADLAICCGLFALVAWRDLLSAPKTLSVNRANPRE